jgi:hypothetical protein
MEFAKIEMNAVREVSAQVESTIVELSDLELILVGGGTGDVQFG